MSSVNASNRPFPPKQSTEITISSGSDEHNRASDYESIADDPQTRSRRTAYAVTGVGSWALDQCRDQSVTPDLSYTDYVLGPLSGEDTRGREHLYASLERADAFRNKNLRKLGFRYVSPHAQQKIHVPTTADDYRLLRNKLAGKRQGDVHYDTTKD